MKKLVIAAALAAMSASVSAQTVYGVFAAGVSQIDTNGSGNATSTAGKDRLSTSVLGIKGGEDLGGGLKAEFDFQGNLLAESGTAGNTANSVLFDRQSWLGLNSTQFGSIRFGRQSSVMDTYAHTANAGNNLFDQDADVSALAVKAESTVRYDSPNLGGLVISFSNSTDGSSLNSITDEINAVGASFSAGALSVNAAVAEAKSSAGTLKNQTVGGSYKLGSATVQAQYQNSKTAVGVKIDQTKLTGMYQVTAATDVRGTFQQRRRDGSNTGDYNVAGVMAVHALSKRTALWVGYADKDFQDTTADTKETTFGIQHAF